jgi:cell shape-determining protein MreC
MQRTISQPNSSVIDYTHMHNSSVISQNTARFKNANFKHVRARIQQITDNNDELLKKLDLQEKEFF